MKIRADLLKHATPKEALKEVLANNSRYKPELLFSLTGVGSLSSASTRRRASEVARSAERIQKALRQPGQTGKQHAVKNPH